MAPPGPVEDAELKAGIARFYDASSALWEDMWGEHMHHGYYAPGPGPAAAPADSAAAAAEPAGPAGGAVQGLRGHQLAQIEMIERSLAWAGVAGGSTAVILPQRQWGCRRQLVRQLSSCPIGPLGSLE